MLTCKGDLGLRANVAGHEAAHGMFGCMETAHIYGHQTH
jgi:hypothetical protein